MAKTLWNILIKKDTLWVKWVNEFFLRGCPIWDWMPKRDSPPVFKNLVRLHDEMVKKVGSKQGVLAVLEPWRRDGSKQVGSKQAESHVRC